MDALTLTELCAGYRGRTVLRNITTSIPAGRTTALVGHNGSGKSTLLNVLAEVHPKTQGTIHRRHLHRPALAVQRSSVPDSLPITTRHVVAMGRWAHRGFWGRLRKPDRAIVTDAMERMGIRDLAERRFDALSGGQRQRAFLAQVLAQQSDLILLDEPETGLDIAIRDTLIELLNELAGDKTTIVHATHVSAFADRADHRIHLADGRITGIDST